MMRRCAGACHARCRRAARPLRQPRHARVHFLRHYCSIDAAACRLRCFHRLFFIHFRLRLADAAFRRRRCYATRHVAVYCPLIDYYAADVAIPACAAASVCRHADAVPPPPTLLPPRRSTPPMMPLAPRRCCVIAAAAAVMFCFPLSLFSPFFFSLSPRCCFASY